MDYIKEIQKSGKIISMGNSMHPLFKDGDLMCFSKTPFAQIHVNDIVILRIKTTIITHRVIYKTNKYLITKGDNSLMSDERIYNRQIIGKLIKTKRKTIIIYPETHYFIQSAHYFNQIIKINNNLRKSVIPHLFLKGLPLHLFYEKTHPKRIYADCDLLISNASYDKVERILLNQEFTKSDSSISSFHKKRANYTPESAYTKKINQFPVVFDIHTQAVFMMTQLGKLNSLYPSKKIDQMTKEFLDTKRKIKVQNSSFFILSPHHLIVYLALHLFHHNFRGAFRYSFLDVVTRKESRRNIKVWKDIDVCIREYQLSNYVYPVFLFLKNCYKTPIPNSTMVMLKENSTLSKASILKIRKTPIFDDQTRSQAGIERFKLLFFLSPVPLWRRVWVFANPVVIYTIVFLLFRKIQSKLKLIHSFIAIV